MTRALPYLAMGTVVAGNVLGNIFLKLGSSAGADRTSLFGMFAWQTAAGIGFFASAVLLYAWALKNLPLHIAQGVASLQFVGAILAATFIFDESISLQKWFGIGLICIGLMFVTG
ncbi:EamA-like transporter family protein [Rhizobiales bacterium GAS113]|nr:EamA-like transporter family protein [Rhizobiales bacterium GAS113]